MKPLTPTTALSERWPGYNEQSWQERFAYLNELYREALSKMLAAPHPTKPQQPDPLGFVSLSDPAVDKLLADLDQAIEEGAGHLALECARIVRLMRKEHRRLHWSELDTRVELERSKAKPQPQMDFPADWRIEGSIYDGFMACISDGKRTIAHVIEYADAVTIMSAIERALSSQRAEGIEEGDHRVFAFLLGEGPLEGSWFGDTRPSGERDNFWWREHLRRALTQDAG